MTGRSDWRPMAVMVAVAMIFAVALYSNVGSGLPLAGGTPDDPSPSPTATPRPPDVEIVHETCCEQAARLLDASWTADERVTAADLVVEPAPPFECGATVDATGRGGRFGCTGFLQGAQDHVATLRVTTGEGTFEVVHRFRTMGDRLVDVKWFTEFEDPNGQPLACAAASCRIVQLYTTGEDKMTATEILAFGQPFNVSRDPGLDPVAITTLLDRLDARNDYHYYRFTTREEATNSAIYWLLHSGKPVIAITLAGQHAPLVIGFEGTYGQYFGDPANDIRGVVVQDPQRGDLREETNRRPDKYRRVEFQTGHLLGLEEWYGDEWWLAFPYAETVRVPGTQTRVNVERNDGAYPLPHWVGNYILIVDDGDTDWPPDKEGRARFR